MPPEPLPWDRKELRRHEGGGGGGGVGRGGFGVGGGGGGGPRWREAPFPHHHPYGHHHHHNNHHHSGGGPPRWLPDFRYRPPPGHGKQGGRHLYLDDFGHGFMPSRPNDKMIDDESCRPSGSGRYGRNSRENRGSFGQKEWKGYSSEISPQPNGLGRPNSSSEQRSVDNMQTYNSSHPNSDFVNSRDQAHPKDQHDIEGGIGATGGKNQKFEKENSIGSIGWKPLKWTRSGCLSSRGSGFNHSSKSIAADFEEAKVELLPKNVTSVPSPPGDTAAACVMSVASSEETSSRKKPRLGWGEGLAKYEKKKVDGADDSAIKDGTTACGSNSEAEQSHTSNLVVRSPRVAGFMDCTSPATPSSVTCSSSPGLEEKQLVKDVTVEHGSTNLCSSPSILSQNHSDELTFNLENLGLTSISQLNSSINELLQSNDPSSVDSCFWGSTAINKLLVWKNDISKTLEATESEIDMLENELKSLISESESSYTRVAACRSVPAECGPKPCDDHSSASHITLRPAALRLVPSGCMIVESAVNKVEDEHAPPKDEDVDSPGSATSAFVEMLSSGKDVCTPDVLQDVEGLMNPDVNKSGNLEAEFQMHELNDEKPVGLPTHEVESQLRASNSATSSDDKLQPGRVEGLYELILASNRDCAHMYSELYSKLLPTSEYHFDISSVVNASCLHNDSVKERFLRRKRFLRFKERVITLKFKIYRHLWKEDIRLLSLKKHRTKSQKKFDSSLRALNSGYQKHRSSVRSRYTSTASLSLVSTTEMLNYASRLLTDSQVNPQRNMLKMPAMILDKHERMVSRFISSNGLVEDPCAVEKERALMNPWTLEEKEMFMDKLALFGKNFRKIASFLDHKTTADCVEFYYKNHKSDSFEKIKKLEFPKQAKSLSTNTYLVASGKRCYREVNAVSLDMLGAASAIAANVDDSVEIQQRCSSKSFSVASSSYRMPRCEDGMSERSHSLDVFNCERETVAADVLAGICGSLSSEAMSSCITSSVDPGEGYQEWKYQRVGSSTRRPLTPEVTQDVEDETCSDESCAEMDPADWTDEEKSIFIQSVSSYGRDFSMISRCVRTRSREQCKVFFSKARKCLGLDMICPGPGNLVRDYTNGGGSDMEDACVIETGSVICSEKSGLKREEVVPSPDMKLKQDDKAEMTNVKPDLNRVEEDNEGGDMDSTDTELMSKNLVSDDCQMDDKPELNFGGEVGSRNGGSLELTYVQDHDNVLISSNLEVAQGVGCANNHNLFNVQGSEGRSGNVKAINVGDPKVKLEEQRIVPESNLISSETENGESGQSDVNDVKCFLQDGQSEVRLTGSDSHSAADTSSSVSGVASGLQKKTDLELNSARNPCVVSLQQTDCSAPLGLAPKVSATTKHEKSPNDDQAALDLGKISDEHRGKASRTNGQHLSRHSALEHLESSSIIKGYPVPISAMKEMSGDLSCKSSISFQSIRRSNGVHFGRGSSQDSYLQRCNSSKPVDSGGEVARTSQEESKDWSRPTSGSSSDVDKPCSNGDVKLFGQILSKPSSQHIPNSNVKRDENKSTQQDNVGSKSSSVKCFSNHSVDGHSASAKYDRSNFVGLENLPVRSFGFWDRNGMQNGVSPLPDSAILLAKYPAAFANYGMTSSKMEQPALHGVGKNGDCNLNSVSVFPTRDINGSNGVADFHMYKNQELQPFTIDMRQRHDVLFSEMQRRNGFEVVSGMQQQSRGMVGINVVGRGGVLVGGQCTGVSDPVAALRMHYAKAEQFSGQTGSFIREDESWRGKGNIGR